MKELRRKVRSGKATGLGRSAAGEGGGRVGAFDWTGEEKSAPELRRAIGSRCSGCQTFPEIDPRLQAHEKLDLPWGVPRRSWMGQ